MGVRSTLRRNERPPAGPLADLDNHLDAVERRRWPLPSSAALVGVVGLVMTVRQAAAH
ncbi:hypothetical protein [Streptomyces sp. YGL11-2]|uniref:hypothetical protein n=1 Tax=Streptomyces sp. YGL11-2 TaxID=3414028 RepID=UPI003CF7BA4B